MKKLLLLIAMMLFAVTLTACAGEDEQPEDELKWVEVDVEIEPEKPMPNEPVTFKAVVTYGDEVVTDARDMTFEIWRSQDEKHEEYEVEKATDGAYQLEKTFDREGTYYVIAHVTAESMHNMPRKEFVIGTPSEPEDKNSKSQFMENNSDMPEMENEN
ncbi:FixH family protein [Bacillus marasmi]|uniref:FixH family protein n=1 Tax=Bacillus marasmi TaxID=1926279 RepID=UPI0011CBA2C5|nr:FixH family protein [Bacillus marasmi]